MTCKGIVLLLVTAVTISLAETNEWGKDCNPEDYLRLSVAITEDYMVIGARGGFQPNVYYTTQNTPNGMRYVAIQKKGEDDTGRIIWALYSTKNGRPDSVYVDKKEELFETTFFQSVGEGVGGKTAPRNLKKALFPGKVVSTLGGGDVREMTAQEVKSAVVAPLSAFDVIVKNLFDIYSHFNFYVEDYSEIILVIEQKGSREELIRRLRGYRSFVQSLKDIGYNHINLAFLDGFNPKYGDPLTFYQDVAAAVGIEWDDIVRHLFHVCNDKEKRIPYAKPANHKSDSGDSLNSTTVSMDSMTDSRDGQTYKTMRFGQQVWMVENLNYKMDDGEQSWCYDNDPANCEKYGRLYTWEAAKKVCPSGWHLPSKEESEILLEKLKKAHSSARGPSAGPMESERAWMEVLDKHGFSAHAGRFYNGSSKKEFYGLDGSSYFWSSMEINWNLASLYIIPASGKGPRVHYTAKNDGLSVRCLKDSELGKNAEGASGKDTKESVNDAVKTAEKSDRSMTQEDFREKMKNVRWKKISERISVPSFMEQKNGDTPFYEYFLYDEVMILNPLIPAHWDGYLSEGGLIAPDVKVRNITYKRKSISSGYTDDGRIFYLKTLYYPSCTTGGHLGSYILIYPKEYQETVEPIINMILHWDYTKEERDAISSVEKGGDCVSE